MNVIINIGQAGLSCVVPQAVLPGVVPQPPVLGSSVYLGSFGGDVIQPFLENRLGRIGRWVSGLFRRSSPGAETYDPQSIMDMIKEVDVRLADPSAGEDEDMSLLDQPVIDRITKKAKRTPEETMLLAKFAGLQRIQSVWPLRTQVAAVQVVGKTASVLQFIKSQPLIKRAAIFGLETTRVDMQEALKAGIKLTATTAGLGDSRQDIFVISRMEQSMTPLVQRQSKLGTLLVADLRMGQEPSAIISELKAFGWFAEITAISDKAFIVAVKNSIQKPAEAIVPRPHKAGGRSRFSSSTSMAAVTTGRNVVLGLAAKCKGAGVDLTSLPVNRNRNTWTGVYTLEQLANDVFENVGRYIAHAETLGLATKSGGQISSKNMHELKLLADAFLSIVVAYEFATKKGEKPFLPYAIKMVELFKMRMESKNLAAIMFAIGKALEEKKRSANVKLTKQELQEAVGADQRNIHETIKAILAI